MEGRCGLFKLPNRNEATHKPSLGPSRGIPRYPQATGSRGASQPQRHDGQQDSVRSKGGRLTWFGRDLCNLGYTDCAQQPWPSPQTPVLDDSPHQKGNAACLSHSRRQLGSRGQSYLSLPQDLGCVRGLALHEFLGPTRFSQVPGLGLV